MEPENTRKEAVNRPCDQPRAVTNTRKLRKASREEMEPLRPPDFRHRWNSAANQSREQVNEDDETAA